MAQPLDIRVTAHPERGLVVIIEGTELNTTGMENSAVLWGVVSYIVNRLPDDGHMDDLRLAAAQMTEYFRQAARPRQNGDERMVEEFRIRQRENGVEGLEECPPPPNECPICFEPHSEGAQWVTLRHCGHCFHFDCISGWREPTCPLCRNGYTRNTRQRAV